jgi:hypothetical protein
MDQRWPPEVKSSPESTLTRSSQTLVCLASAFSASLTFPDKLWELVNSQPSITPAQKAAIKSMYGEVIKSLGQSNDESAVEIGSVENPAVARAKGGAKQRRSSSQFLRPNVEDRTEVEEAHLPFLHLKRKTATDWAYSQKLTNICSFFIVRSYRC